MRRYHRWLSVLFGVVLLWIAVTGVLSQVGSLVNNGGFEREAMEPGKRQAAAIGTAALPPAQAREREAAAAPLPAAFVCPADMVCRLKQPVTGWNVSYLHHLHSGEEFGPAGVVVSILGGLALVFFAFSGLWMYVRMWSHRRDKEHKPMWFWK